MGSIKISAMTAAASLTGDELVPLVQNGANKKATVTLLQTGRELLANKSTNVVTDAASDVKYPSVKAIKDYADGLVVGLLDDRGSYNASTNVFPSTGGSGVAGAIMKGDLWYISVSGTLGGVLVAVGSSLRALVDNPGQTAGNWDMLNVGIGYTSENSTNKVTSISGASTDVQYGSAKLLYDQLALKEAAANKENSTIDTSTTKFPTVNLLKTGLDGKQATLSFGIANTNKVQINSADVASGEYAKFTTTGLESRSTAEVLSDIGGEASANKVTSLSGGSTNVQYPSAKLTYDQLALKANLISPSFTTPNIGVATGSISGNAGTATKLAATKNINGVAFDGSVNIVIPSLNWAAVTSNGNLAVDTGTLANKGTLLTLTLPATAAVGKVISVAGMNAGLWRIAQNANQIIHFGSTNTTTGTGGYLESTLAYDTVELICVVANLEFVVKSSMGNITIN